MVGHEIIDANPHVWGLNFNYYACKRFFTCHNYFNIMIETKYL